VIVAASKDLALRRILGVDEWSDAMLQEWRFGSVATFSSTDQPNFDIGKSLTHSMSRR
jgi:hypothetical protein